MSEEPSVTIIVVPRDWFSITPECLDRMLECTPEPRRVIVVDGGSPPEIAGFLERRARECDLTLIRSDHLLSPNEARNLGIALADTEWVVIADNDLYVEPGWLERLVRCAEETSASAVIPRVHSGRPDASQPHFVGGDCGVRDDDGAAVFWERQYLYDEPESIHDARRPCGLFEFHLVLFNGAALRAVTPFDERMRSMLDHVDLALALREHGGSIWYEPSVTVTTIYPRPPRGRDLDYYLVRWSDDWNRRSGRRFVEKWRLPPTDARVAMNIEFGAWLRNRAYLPYRSPFRPVVQRRGRSPRPIIDRLLQRRARRRYDRQVASSAPPRVSHAASWVGITNDA